MWRPDWNGDGKRLDVATVAAHGVRAPAPEALPDGMRGVPSAEPIYQTAVIDFDSIAASLAPLAGEGGYVYARHGMPNGRSLELTVAALEGAEDALATSSGMAAVACAILATARTGDRVLVQEDAYGGTLGLLRLDLTQLGIEVETVSAYDLAAMTQALGARPKLLIVETLSNPLVRPIDLPAIAAGCAAQEVVLLVDNTFATPVFARPLENGADAVIHSATKFLGGHHDLCAGVLAGTRVLIDAARGVARRFGSVAAPFDAWLACRGIRTLAVRMERAQDNARELARRLDGDPRVKALHYPGWGAMLSFDVGGATAAERVVRTLRLILLAPSLGGTNSSVSHPATSSHRGLPPSERARLGIGDGLLRLSVGIESVVDLWRDLDAGLEC